MSIYRRLTRFYIPQKLNDYIGQKKSKFIPFLPNPVLITKVMLYCSPILALFLCYACYDIQLNISKVPRNIITFLVGSVVAIYTRAINNDILFEVRESTWTHIY